MPENGIPAQYHQSLRAIMHRAGDAILEVYSAAEGVEVMTKDDDSPLTIADQRAHKIIVEGLRELDSSIPVLSEESDLQDYEIRRQWQRYWLVDPLDGTKEFINRNGEFTVNIALIESGRPVAGWVYVPVKEKLYYGWSHDGQHEAFLEESDKVETISRRRLNPEGKVVVVASRRHGGEALQGMLEKAQQVFSEVDLQSIGSSLKICLVAEGKADWYPRLAPTSEWDTAAAHAVLLGAGGVMVDTELASLEYNQKESILNPFFHALGETNEIWQSLLKE
ncbi:3'(2'),5'-bisphosphate nucleotidase CysQ [Hahella ganghwensis]|uniref:3'(2'),5'-bisphosphate nucleotidase CysQ n=1 Tax=Hahella ganghwensis TaxID=286420 RepID=UPI00035CA893|nr:3'(2'),5'-bisphosphate nucleotidase CysQ [Hahella ganghwensis]